MAPFRIIIIIDTHNLHNNNAKPHLLKLVERISYHHKTLGPRIVRYDSTTTNNTVSYSVQKQEKSTRQLSRSGLPLFNRGGRGADCQCRVISLLLLVCIVQAANNTTPLVTYSLCNDAKESLKNDPGSSSSSMCSIMSVNSSSCSLPCSSFVIPYPEPFIFALYLSLTPFILTAGTSSTSYSLRSSGV